jgi:serine phosphatase RsbU (regulator of sigma subunit)/PAS domain-containing protein
VSPTGAGALPEVLDALPLAVVALDAELRIVGWNEAAGVLYCTDSDQALGAPMLELLFDVDDRAAAEPLLRGVLAGEAWEGDLRIRRGDGNLLVSSFRAAPVSGGVLWIATDGMDQGLAEQERSVLLSAEHAARRTAEEALGLVEAVITSAPIGIAVFDLDLRYVRVNAAFAELSGTPPEEHPGRDVGDVLRLPSDFGADLRRVVTTGRTILGRPVALDDRHFTVGYYPVRTSTGDLVGAGATLVEVTAARRAEAERVALLARAEAAQARLSVLATASTVLTSTMDVDELLGRLAQVLTPSVADWCVIQLVNGGVVEHVAVSHRDRAAARELGVLLGSSPVTEAGDRALASAMRAGQGALVSTDVLGAAIRRAAGDRPVPNLAAARDATSSVVVPIGTRTQTEGVLLLSTERDRRLTDDDLDLAVEVAHRAALALGNARAYQHEHQIAESLQRAMLPDTVPAIEGLELTVRYLAATDGVSVGGDRYDVVEFDDHEVGIVIRDILGHDNAASTTMGQVRSALRAFACEEHADPAGPLSRLDRLFDVLSLGSATCVFGVIDEGATTFRWSNAGHPPPLLLRGGTASFLDDGAGIMLGVTGGAGMRRGACALQPDDVVVLYTDGLVERRTDSLDAGFDRLLAAALDLDLRQTGPALADQLLAAMLPSEVVRGDDVALLVVRVRAESPAAVHEIRLASDAHSPALARGFLAGLLEGAGWLDAVDTATLLVSVLVTNALSHGHAPCSLRVQFLEPDTVEVSVQDADATLPTLQHPDRMSEHGRGMLLVDALATRWGIRPVPGGKQVWFTLTR